MTETGHVATDRHTGVPTGIDTHMVVLTAAPFRLTLGQLRVGSLHAQVPEDSP